MDEGNNFGAINGGNNQPDNSLSNPNSFDQPTTAIMSSSDEQGGIPTISTEGASNSSKFFGSHARRSSRRIDSQQSDFLAAQNIASNPNNPQFFRDAAAENAATYIQPEAGRSKKPIIIGAIIAAIFLIAIICIIPFTLRRSTDDDIPEEFSDIVEKYVTQIIGKKYKENLDSKNINYDLTYDVVSYIDSYDRDDSDKYYKDTDKLAETILQKMEKNDEKYASLEQIIKQSREHLFLYYETSKVIFVETGKEYSIDEFKTLASELKNNKESFGNDKNSYGAAVYDMLLSYINNKIEILRVYKNNNCINNNDLDYNCVEKIESDSFSNILDSSNIMKSIEGMHQSSKKVIISGAYMTNNLMEESND